MRIQELLQREPFGSIVERTLGRFFQEVTGRPAAVTWASGAHVRPTAWLCNPLLNAIFPSDAEPAVREHLRKEYATHPNHWKMLLQSPYVRLGTTGALAPLFSRFRVRIDPTPRNNRWMLIAGGNNKLRIMDFREGRVWCILKDGFDPCYVQREIAVRTLDGFPYAPPIRAMAADQSWFEEDYLDGVALNRLPRGQDRRPLIEEACVALRDWIGRTLAPVDQKCYTGQLAGEIRTWIGRKGPLAASKALVGEWLEDALHAIERGPDAPAQIPAAIGHGDFQQGNIVVGRERMWLVDWERSRTRQSAYDYFVLALRSRFPRGLAARIGEAVADPGGFYGKLPVSWPEVGHEPSPATLRGSLALFLLEELHWNLEENANPNFFRESGAWLLFRDEMGPALRALAA